MFFASARYCKVKVKAELLADLLPGPVTLVFERSEVLNKDLNPFTPVSQLILAPTLELSGPNSQVQLLLFAKC